MTATATANSARKSPIKRKGTQHASRPRKRPLGGALMERPKRAVTVVTREDSKRYRASTITGFAIIVTTSRASRDSELCPQLP